MSRKNVIDAPQKSKEKILLIGDEPDILNLIGKFLALGDFEVIKSTNTKKALKIIEEHYNEISWVLLDIMMPGRSREN